MQNLVKWIFLRDLSIEDFLYKAPASLEKDGDSQARSTLQINILKYVRWTGGWLLISLQIKGQKTIQYVLTTTVHVPVIHE